MAGFKRKRVSFAMSPFRKKFFRKRRFTGRFKRKSFTQTSQSSRGGNLPFKSRRVSRRSWNRKLWDSTLQKAHYRSNGAAGTVISTAVGINTATVSFIDAMHNSSGVFWTSLGGATSLDEATTIPEFVDDIIVRGGKACLSFYNTSDVEPVEIECFLIKPAPRLTTANIPSSVTIGWDPSMISEFKKDIGTIIYKTKFLLEPSAVSTVQRRIGIMKIDQESWTTDGQRMNG